MIREQRRYVLENYATKTDAWICSELTARGFNLSRDVNCVKENGTAIYTQDVAPPATEDRRPSPRTRDLFGKDIPTAEEIENAKRSPMFQNINAVFDLLRLKLEQEGAAALTPIEMLLAKMLNDGFDAIRQDRGEK